MKVKGTVTDDFGSPLTGVNIHVEGTTSGVISNLTRQYSINLPNLDAVLILSCIGFSTERIPVSGKTDIDIKLKQDSKVLNEVVVIGYSTIRKNELTTAISQIKPSDVTLSANNSLNSLLFGRAAGLNITQSSAEPDGNINISIRGWGNPLIVLDGMVVANNALQPSRGQGEMNGGSEKYTYFISSNYFNQVQSRKR